MAAVTGWEIQPPLIAPAIGFAPTAGPYGTTAPVNIMDPIYNVDPTGVVSANAAIEAAIADVALTGGTLLFPYGRYKLTGTGVVIGRGNITIDGNGSSVLDCTGLDTGAHGLHFGGSISATTTTCTHDVAIGDTQITVASAADFAVGDFCKFTSTEYFNGISGASGYGLTTKGEFLQISFISGNVITFESGILDSYTRAAFGSVSPNTQTLTKMNFLEKINVKGLGFEGPAQGSSWLGSSIPSTARGLGCFYVRGLKINDCRWNNFSSFALMLNHVLYSEVSGNVSQGLDLTTASNQGATLSPWFYFINNVSVQGQDFTRNIGYRHRHFMDGGGGGDGLAVVTRALNVVGNLAHSCANPFICHQAADALFAGNTIISGRGGAFDFRGRNVAIVGNRATYCGGAFASVGGPSDQGYDDNGLVANGNVLIANNVVDHCDGRFLTLTGDSDVVSVTGNVATNMSENGIRTISNRIRSMNISGNYFHSPNRPALDDGVYGIEDDNFNGKTLERGAIRIIGNTFDNFATGVLIEGCGDFDLPGVETPADNIDISGNTFLNIDNFDLRLGNDSGARGFYGDNIRVQDNLFSKPLASAVSFTFGYMFKAFPAIGGNRCLGEPVYEYWPTAGVFDGTEDNGHQHGRTVRVGDKFDKVTPTAAGVEGYVVTAAGTMGSTVRTGSMTSGTNILTTTASAGFMPGNYISIPTAGPAAATLKTRVTAVTPDKMTFTTTDTASSTATAQTINYANPTIKARGVIAA